MKTIFITSASASLGKTSANLCHAHPGKRNRAAVARALGDIDVVFNNAGHGLVGVLEADADAQLVGHRQANVPGVRWVARAFLSYSTHVAGHRMTAPERRPIDSKTGVIYVRPPCSA